MSKKTTGTETLNTTIEPKLAGNAIKHVKANFDGLRKVVGKLPEGKDKFVIMEWVGDAYLSAAETIFSLAGGNFIAEGTAA